MDFDTQKSIVGSLFLSGDNDLAKIVAGKSTDINKFKPKDPEGTKRTSDEEPIKDGEGTPKGKDRFRSQNAPNTEKTDKKDEVKIKVEK